VEELLARLAPSTAVTSDELMIVRPESKHIGTLGITSMIEHMYVPIGYLVQILMPSHSLDEGFKSSAYLP
jgi:hypothetical protein